MSRTARTWMSMFLALLIACPAWSTGPLAHGYSRTLPSLADDSEEVQKWVTEVGGSLIADPANLDGPPTGVSLDGTAITDADLPRLKKLGKLTDVSLRETAITDAGLFHLAKMPGLESLALDGTKITDKGLPLLLALGKLKELRLNATAITDEGMAPVAAVHTLEGLEITGTIVTDTGLARLAGLAGLKQLTVDSTRITDAGLDSVARLGELTTLNLGHTRISDQGLARLARLNKLEDLDLAETQVTDAGLAQLKELASLSILKLDGTAVTDKGLGALKGLPGLTSLSLNATAITDAGAQRIAAFEKLEDLSLAGTAVTDRGLGYLRGLKGLTGLDLGKTAITDAGLPYIKGLAELTSLTLRGTKITDNGLVHLRGLVNLWSLDLGETAITDAGLVQLKGLKALMSLDLDGTKVTEEGAKKFSEAMGNVIVRLTPAEADVPAPPKPEPIPEDKEARRKAIAEASAQADRFRSAMQFDKALAAAERMLAIEREEYGPAHDDLAGSLERIAAIYLDQEDFAQAKAKCEEALAMRRKLAQGDEDYRVRRTRLKLLDVDKYAGLKPEQRRQLRETNAGQSDLLRQFGKGEAREALAKAWDGLKARRAILGDDHLDTALALANFGTLQLSAGQAAEGKANLETALAMGVILLGESSDFSVSILTTLGELARLRGDYPTARRHLEKALATAGTVFPPKHASVGVVHNNLGLLLQTQGDYAAALPHFQQALEILLATRGPDDPNYLTSMQNIGMTYLLKGDYAKARPCLESALRDARRIGSPFVISNVLNNLSLLLRSQRDFASADAMMREALQISKKTYGNDHPNTVAMLNNLALLESERGQYAQAHTYYEELVEIDQRTGRDQQPDHAMILNNLATALMHGGKPQEAVPHLEKALAIYRRTVGENNPANVLPLSNLGTILAAQGEIARGRASLEKALELCRQGLGAIHPQTAEAVEANLSLLLAIGDDAAARPLADELLQIRIQLADSVVGTLSEAEAMSYVDAFRSARSVMLTVLRRTAKVKPEDAYAAVWLTRGVATRALAARHELSGASPEARATWEELRAVRTQLAQLMLAPLTTAQGAARRDKLKELTTKKEELERQLAEHSRAFQDQQAADRATFADLAACLPRGTAVVDIVQVVELEPVRKGSIDLRGTPHYEVFILQPDAGSGCRLEWVHLGPAGPIDQALRAWRKLLTSRQPPTAAELAAAPEQTLRRLVWKPIEAKLRDCSTVIVVPDGAISSLPWCALPGAAPDSHLLDTYAFGIASHGQLLVELANRAAPKGDRLLAVGGVNYGRNPKYPADRQPNAYLKMSLPEAAKIAQMSREFGFHPELLTGLDASSPAVQARMPQCRFIHLSTHGIYLDPQGFKVVRQEAPAGGSRQPAGRRETAAGRNPLAFSALSLANANVPPKLNWEGLPEGSSGMLTAEEIVELDLSGTEMVVLSACQTGLGDVAGGEGVFGLQRAFGLAGARTVVATLWSIPDDELLMPLFYALLWDKKISKVEALRQAQLAICDAFRRAKSDDPAVAYRKVRYWGAWSLSGDPGQLLRGK